MRRKHKKHIIKTWILSIAALAVGIVFVSPLYLVFVNSVKTVREIYLSPLDRKSTRLNSSHYQQSRMPSSA